MLRKLREDGFVSTEVQKVKTKIKIFTSCIDILLHELKKLKPSLSEIFLKRQLTLIVISRNH